MRKIFLLLALMIAGTAFAQENPVNNYKYVIVPRKFEFFKEPNKYNLNELTKMVFEKYGFTVFFADEKLPDELALDRCKALYGDLDNDSGLLATNVYILLKDCSGQVVYKSEKGNSKIKDYKKAYYEALREASASMASLNYKYNGTGSVSTKAMVVEEVKFKPLPDAAATTTPATVTPVVNDNQLFAQPIANGYQLVDMTPKVVLKMYKTSQPDNFTAQGEGKNGVVFKKGNEWFFEYYKDDKLVSEKLNIKF
ncbi:hypothetical protein OGH69_08370 [Flavobacterium sp. MFBS3-15]|uniref:hypothetical protein n=1 Tax=Flavobacterium sp. MFBS3-15 TaxID=2989816 RepID=UPI00223632B5|nr:hypothetical protein [Flavobacterium sp. MFBS3-15]MCW4468974.1 hypothetical protein [Flavobacterium sp. MFBS3-15]